MTNASRNSKMANIFAAYLFFVNVKIGGVKLTLSCIQKCEVFFPAQVSDIVLVAKLLIIAIYVI